MRGPRPVQEDVPELLELMGVRWAEIHVLLALKNFLQSGLVFTNVPCKLVEK